MDKSSKVLNATLSSEELTEKYKHHKVKFIVFPLIFQYGTNLFGAERGTGKTRISLSIAFAIVYALIGYLGYTINEHGDVLFLNFEMAEPEFKLFVEPIENYFKANYKKKYNLHSISFKSHRDLTLKDIDEAIFNIKPLLVIVDGYKAFASMLQREKGIKEIDNSNAMLMYDYFDRWRKDYNTTILLTNHTNKGTKGQRSHSDLMYGASAVMDYADQTTLMRKTNEPNQRIIVPDKNRFNREGESSTNLIEIIGDDENNKIWFELKQTDVEEADYMYKDTPSQKYSHQEKLAAVDMYTNQKISLRDIQERTGIPKSSIDRWVKKHNRNEEL
ncbi:MAG: AAA family ATPase [Bacteroidetes bacterium]|nr:AAA family ATPase [Bacteroidota bacterium]